MTKNFSVTWRNPGHWDIYAGPVGHYKRVYAIRGTPGDFIVIDTKTKTAYLSICHASSVQEAMTYICGQLMKEDSIVEKAKDGIDVYIEAAEAERQLRRELKDDLLNDVIDKRIKEWMVNSDNRLKR